MKFPSSMRCIAILFLAAIIVWGFASMPSSAELLAEEDYQNNEAPPEMLQVKDVLDVINIIEQDYYKPVDNKKLMDSFIEGISKHSENLEKPSLFEGISTTDGIEKAVVQIDKAFEKAGINQEEMQAYLQEGIKTMIESLDNPGCKYFPPSQYRKSLAEMGYSKGGCGFFVDDEMKDANGRWIIIETLQDYPADKKGVQSGDRLIAVDGIDVKKLSFHELASLVRGPIGSETTLTVYRPALQKEVSVTITRTWLGPNPKSLRWEIMPGNVGYIKFRYLGERMNMVLDDIYKEFKEKNVSSVIWDFRNSAGLIQGAVDIASASIEKDRVFAHRFFVDSSESYKGRGDKALLKPDVILINSYTPAAGAFLSMIFKKQHGAVLVGRPVEWKGDGTNSHRIKDGSYITIPFCYYGVQEGLTLKNGEMILPDIDIGQHPLTPIRRGDRQLEKALEIVNEK